jgi:DNA recombination protein RmuC
LLRDSRIHLERSLAVERERSSRLSELENLVNALTEDTNTLRDEKSSTETLLAAATEARTQTEAALRETRERLASAETHLIQNQRSLDELRQKKGNLEEAFARKSEATAQMEVIIRELRQRLLSAEETRNQTAGRLDAVTQEKNSCERSLAEKTAALTEKIEASERLRRQLEECTSAVEQYRTELSDLRTTLATTQETLEQERKQSGEKLALVNEAQDRMTQEFKLLASGIMRQHSEDFSQHNKEQLGSLLGPLRDTLTEFQHGLQNAHHESSKERAALAQSIGQLTDASAKMTLETSNLTSALKKNAPTRGVWGEMVLTSILERSGLREGEEYCSQSSQTNEDGRRRRPDVIVNLPGGQRIIIDSKVSLLAFEAYVNAQSEEKRADELARHLLSIRSHIKALGSKEYHALPTSSLDYVVMFIPIEDALSVALREDGNLSIYATENNVAIATPTTLMIALRTAANVWHVERRNRNAEQIAEHAGKVYGKFVGFVEDLKGLGIRLNQARSAYEGAMNKLSVGYGNLMRQIEYLKSMGAKTTKSLPAELLEDGTRDDLIPVVAADTLEGQRIGESLTH